MAVQRCFEEHRLGTIATLQAVTLSSHQTINYQVGIWKRSHISQPNVPAPFYHHGWTKDDGQIVPDWFEGNYLVPPMFTYTLVEIVEAENQEDRNGETDGFMYIFDNQDEEETHGSDYEDEY